MGIFASSLLSPFNNQATLLGLGVIDCQLYRNIVTAVFITASMSPQEILKENLRMFELVQKHPSHWPPFVPPAKPEVTTTGAGKWLFRGPSASRPRCSSWFMR